MSPSAWAEVYQWVDESGTVHFSDEKPEHARYRQVEAPPVNTYHATDYEVPPVRARDPRPEVVMYGTSWCPYCAKARRYFAANRIPYVEYDVEKDASAKRRFDALGGTGYPLILVGDRRMSGFSISRFERIYP